MVNGSIDLYKSALEFSEKVIEYFPRCATAHYFAGFACLKCKGDQNYTRQKYKLIQSLSSEEADILAKKLEEEIERTRDISVISLVDIGRSKENEML